MTTDLRITRDDDTLRVFQEIAGLDIEVANLRDDHEDLIFEHRDYEASFSAQGLTANRIRLMADAQEDANAVMEFRAW